MRAFLSKTTRSTAQGIDLETDARPPAGALCGIFISYILPIFLPIPKFCPVAITVEIEGRVKDRHLPENAGERLSILMIGNAVSTFFRQKVKLFLKKLHFLEKYFTFSKKASLFGVKVTLFEQISLELPKK